MSAKSVNIFAMLCLVAVAPVRADSMSACNSKNADRKIQGCSAVIAATYLKRGRAYFVKKDYEQAIADFSKSIRLANELRLDAIRDETYAFRGMAYMRIGPPDRS